VIDLKRESQKPKKNNFNIEITAVRDISFTEQLSLNMGSKPKQDSNLPFFVGPSPNNAKERISLKKTARKS
jgi:hypothetical protein